MTVDQLREQLIAERDKLDGYLTLLDELSPPRRRRRTVERRTTQRRKKLHWTQRPENRAKVKALSVKMKNARLKK